MENRGLVPIRLQRFLRLTALRRGIKDAKLIALIVKGDEVATIDESLPSVEMIGWDFDSALVSLASSLGTGGFVSIRYAGFCDHKGCRRYVFELEPSPGGMCGINFIDASQGLTGAYRKHILMALKRRKASV